MENAIVQEKTQLSAAEAVAHIRAQVGNELLYKNRKRGYVDWKFGELAAYRGYEGAVEYAESVTHWYDFDKYKDSLLITTYQAFRAAEAEVGQTGTICQ